VRIERVDLPVTAALAMRVERAVRLPAVGVDTINGSFTENGVFTADGAQHITGGIDDFNTASALPARLTGSFPMAQKTERHNDLYRRGEASNLASLYELLEIYLTERDAFVEFQRHTRG